MFNGRTRVLLWLIAASLVLTLVALLFLPPALAALPGRVRQYLPAGLGEATAPPLPTPQPQTALSLSPVDQTRPTVASVPTIAMMATPALTAPPRAQAPPVAPSSTRPSSPSPAPTVALDLPPYVYLEGVKIFPQKFNNCGPTNLSMVLDYHGMPRNQLEIAAVVRPNYEDRNVSPEELAAYVREHAGLQAEVIVGGDLDLLRQLLAAGLPVIIEEGLEPDGDLGWMGHYLTLFGYDEGERVFFTRDSFLGPWDEDGRESYESVLADWRPFNNLMLVVFSDAQRPAVEAVLGDRLTDPQVMWAVAEQQARVEVRADGLDPFAWFNLGSSLTWLYLLSGDTVQLSQAVASFDRARSIGLPARMLWYQFIPYEAYLAAGRLSDVVALADATLGSQGGRSVEETYVYRALALRAQGNETAAAGDMWRAELLYPQNPILLDVLRKQP